MSTITYSFELSVYDDDTASWDNASLEVFGFTVVEEISRPYEIDLLAKLKASAEEPAVLNSRCKLTIKSESVTGAIHDERVFHGIGIEVERSVNASSETELKIKVVPRLWLLAQLEASKIFVGETVTDVIEQTIELAGLSAPDYDLDNLTGPYELAPIRVQYNETYLDFLHRVLEREGIYYRFDVTSGSDQRDKIVFMTSANEAILNPTANFQQSDSAVLEYSSSAKSTGMGATALASRTQTFPNSVTVFDYNEEDPTNNFSCKTVISAKGIGNIQINGLNLRSAKEATRVAGQLAESFKCMGKTYTGESDAAAMSASTSFTLSGHASSDFNIQYLPIRVTHLMTTVSTVTNYSNTFEAIEDSGNFYPKLSTEIPKIEGQLHAQISDTSSGGTSDYADPDDHGRYQVTFSFDFAASSSCYLRKIESYGGESKGMHFPLLAGTYVLIGFIGGHPDKPYITGTIGDNNAQKSVVTRTNKTINSIKTKSGNAFELDDTIDSEKISLKSAAGTSIEMTDTSSALSKHHLKLETQDTNTRLKLQQDGASQTDGIELVTSGNYEYRSLRGSIMTHFASSYSEPNEFISNADYFAFPKRDTNGEHVGIDGVKPVAADNPAQTSPTKLGYSDSEESEGKALYFRTVGDKYIHEQGIEYHYNTPGDTRFQFGADKNVVVCQPDVDIPTNYYTDDDVADEQARTIARDANKNLQTTVESTNANGVTESRAAQEEILNFLTNITGYMPFSTAQNESPPTTRYSAPLSQNKARYIIENSSQVAVGIHNTFNIQRGNIFDFGGYWSYNLGNSYEENHIQQYTEINRTEDNDKTDEAGHRWQTITTETLADMTNGNVWVTKNYGNSYDYTKGDSLEVNVGKTESHNYGDTYESNDGNADVYHKGNTNEEVTGNSTSKVSGDSTEHVYGQSTSYRVGASSEMQLGAKNDMFFGVSNSMFLGVASEVFIGAKLEVQVAGKVEVAAGPTVQVSPADIIAAASAVKAAALQVSLSNISAKVGDVEIFVNGLSLFLSNEFHM